MHSYSRSRRRHDELQVDRYAKGGDLMTAGRFPHMLVFRVPVFVSTKDDARHLRSWF